MRIAVVGAGPVGLAATLLLRQHGLEPTVFERRKGLCQLPQAHVFNTRTGEILRELGLFESVVAAAAPPERIRYVTWSESLAGRRFGRLPYQGNADQIEHRHASSPARTINIGQDRFEAELFEALRRTGGTVAFGARVVAASSTNGIAILDIETDAGRERREFDLVLACDGANSVVRECLGIEMEGPPSIAKFASAYFDADLSPYLGNDLGPVNFIAGQDVRGAIIGFDMARTWAFMCVTAPDALPTDFTPEVMEELVRRAIGDPDVALELRSIGAWNMSAQIARTFRAGPFFLVGDSAHRFPPTGGLGVNTGIGDAHNLAWKIGAIARGEAKPELLNTYESERRPIASRNRDHSVTNAMRMGEVDEAIGASTLAPVDPLVTKAPWSILISHPIDTDDDTGDQARSEIQRHIDNQRTHFDSLALEIGYTYAPEKSARPEHDRQNDQDRSTVAVGAVFPHAWVGEGTGRRSTLDLVDRFRPTLFVGANVDAWRTTIIHEFGQHGPVVVPLGTDEAAIDPARSALFRPVFHGAVLVRPDGHVSWMGSGGPTRALREDFFDSLRSMVYRTPALHPGEFQE